MRTSRISQDAAQLASALSRSRSQRSAPKRRSLRQYGAAPGDDPLELETAVKTEAMQNGSSPLSTPPDSPMDNATVPMTRKRKRRVDEINAPISPSTSSGIVRLSPRKPEAQPNELSPDQKFPKRTRRQPAKHIKGLNGDLTVNPPANWEEVYSVTAEMRKRVLAPVDTMGCESLAEDDRSPHDRRLQTLIALMLSSQTKDTVTAVAMKNLQQNLPGGFTLSSLLTVSPELLNELIQKVGFHNNKTRFIKSVAVILDEKFNGDIPDTIEGLVSLPGVGPKMAYLCMSAAWGRDEGIGVDVHVHRITNLWGWHKTKNPEETRAELEAWLPREKWHDINHLLVGFGQTICPPVGRKCENCDLAQKGLCPSAVVPKEVKKRVKKEVIVKDESGLASTVEQDVEETDVKLEKADPSAPPLDLTVFGEPKEGIVKLEPQDIEE